jgi:putative membrane protein
MRRLVLWFSTVIALFVVAHLGLGIYATGFWPLVWAAIVLGLVNLTIRPLLRLLTLPLNVLTLGLFGWVISALMLWLVSALVPGFVVTGFIPALLGAVILAAVSGVLHWAVRR